MPARKSQPCTCPRGKRSLGHLYDISMGRGIVRLSTTKGCPEHDTCHGWTKAKRAEQPSWSDAYCPKHGTNDCPTSKEKS